MNMGKPEVPSLSTVYSSGTSRLRTEIGYASEASKNARYKIQDYQRQLMLLEQQNRKRLMMARQEKDSMAVSGYQASDDTNDSGQEAGQSAVRGPSSQQEQTPTETSSTHYTISEDATAVGWNNKLYAMKVKGDSVQPSRNGPGPEHPAYASYQTQHRTASPFPKIHTQAQNQAKFNRKVVEGEAFPPPPPEQKLVAPAIPKEFSFNSFVPPIASQPTIESQTLFVDWEKVFGLQKEESRQATPASSFTAQSSNHANAKPLKPAQIPVDSNLVQYQKHMFSKSTDGIRKDYPVEDQGDQGGFTHNSRCDMLPTTEIDLIRHLLSHIQELEAENDSLRSGNNLEGSSQAPMVNIQVFHCLESDADSDADDNIGYGGKGRTYLAEPHWETHGEDTVLRGEFLVSDPKGYLEKQGDISFVIYKTYTLNHQRSELIEATRTKQPLPKPEPARQDVLLISDEMIKAVTAFFDQDASFRDEFPSLDESQLIESPYLWWYHYRKGHNVHLPEPRQNQLVCALIDRIEATYAPLYDRIDGQFLRGKVTPMSMKYLFRPGRVIVSEHDGLPQGYLTRARPTQANIKTQSKVHDKHKKSQQWSWEIKATSLNYMGELRWSDADLYLEVEVDSEDQEIDIASLGVVPLNHCSPEIRKRLEVRGHTFWMCRDRKLVSYEASSTNDEHAGQRFMVDYNTYKKLHPSSNNLSTFVHYTTGSEKRDEVYQPRDSNSPREPEIYIFPGLIPGFDLRRKKWEMLSVDCIRDVKWNEKAFSSLVADQDMKVMIQALVTNQLASEKGTDLIENKGNGLILLLHGSPGTGKTYTAESVAEIARKPLYPVTCGDIGTEPEEVEKYLESVFYLGKIWDCVVLLDEAEVFLEQRTLQDLKRNALVSIFLRALEYYNGILILTTNRVGTFDEAFKSRIQLALRYEKLGVDQRKQIWGNFVDRLEYLGEHENINLEDLRLHIGELAHYSMNGRQIRNSISTARQLAKYMGTKMTSTHLKRSITLAEKFDKYLADVREAEPEEAGERGKDGRLSDEFFARADQLR